MRSAEASSAAVTTNLPSSSSSSSDPASLLLTRPRRAVSLLTCSKLCGVCFAAGLIVGFTLKRRLRRWAARLLKRIKDD